ncbi:unnamed protein product [Mytilus coruscus]|uniref:B box-type domain-containing protein n=1 Tax=Mytilus coruscus TaxID=42192 RepID=A0A6J8ESV9_MYTCO|nr:unnamed protein product [Mytilus coruscus]
MDLASVIKPKIPNFKKFCELHEEVSLDFYCTQHDTVCCRKCIPSKHQSCKDVLPLEFASEHIKKSSLFDDTFREFQNIAKTLDHLRKDCNDNINEMEKSESTIFVPQVQPVSIESILNLKKETSTQLNLDDNLRISDLAVTADNTLFLCNYHIYEHKVYVYKTNLQNVTYNTALRLPSEPYGIAILKETVKAVVTIPKQSYVQFINTKSLKLDKTIEVGRDCNGITTSEDNIAVRKTEEIKNI